MTAINNPARLRSCTLNGRQQHLDRIEPRATATSLGSQVDPRTRRPVWAMSDADSPSEAVYFEGRGFTADEHHVVFCSTRSGRTELFRSDLRNGTITQLTRAAETGPHDFNVHPDGRRVFHRQGGAIACTDVFGTATRAVVEPGGALSGRFHNTMMSFSADGDRATVVTVDAAGVHFLYVLDLTRGSFDLVLRSRRGFSHPLICPGDRDLITFVPHGNACWRMDRPQRFRARTWIVDVREKRPRPFVTPGHGRTVTHESWCPSGERFYFFEKTYPGWTPASICSVDRQGQDWRTHYTDVSRRLGHGVTSPCGNYFLADTQDPGENPLLLIDLRDGSSRVVCWPNASIEGGHGASAHVHPSFSPSGRFAVYTSDASGLPRVYVVPIGDLMD